MVVIFIWVCIARVTGRCACGDGGDGSDGGDGGDGSVDDNGDAGNDMIIWCISCGEDLEQKVNGVIKYLKVDKHTDLGKHSEDVSVTDNG